MPFQLAIDTLRFSHISSYSKHLQETRGEGAVGAWISQSGELNRVFMLREVTTKDLASPAHETAEDFPELAAAILHKETRLLSAIRPVKPTAASFLDLREYSIVPGKLPAFTRLMLDALPVREKYGPNVGVWVPICGEPDTVIHLWAFDSFEHRERIRASVASEQEWKNYLDAIAPLLGRMRSTFLKPITR